MHAIPVSILCVALLSAGCVSVRVNDSPRTATEQFLVSVAINDALGQLTAVPLRDRLVYVDATYLCGSQAPTGDYAFMLGEIRARLLSTGARITDARDAAEIIVEVRSGAMGIDRTDYVLGIPPLTPSGSSLSIVRRLRQRGYASVAVVAYWRDTGELVSIGGPVIGETFRDDLWIVGSGPRTAGDIPSALR